MKKSHYIDWQLKNKDHIIYIYNMIINELEDNELIINDKKKLYEDIVLYLYQTTFHVKYIY